VDSFCPAFDVRLGLFGASIGSVDGLMGSIDLNTGSILASSPKRGQGLHHIQPHDGHKHVFAAMGQPPCCTCEAERRLCTCETGLSPPRKCLMAFPPRTFAPRLTCSSAAFFRLGVGVE
jgi:hypothetical protein